MPRLPPASPGAGYNGLVQAKDEDLDARIGSIRALLESRKSIDAALVSNLSGNNALRHITLESSLQDILWQLCQDTSMFSGIRPSARPRRHRLRVPDGF